MHVAGALQFDIAWETKSANFAKVRQLLEAARPPKESLIALPEMFATGFSMNAEAIAEPYGGETEQFLADTAKRFGIFLVGGAAMRGKGGAPRNKALVFFARGQVDRVVCENASVHGRRRKGYLQGWFGAHGFRIGGVQCVAFCLLRFALPRIVP
jgi:omega-amidase